MVAALKRRPSYTAVCLAIILISSVGLPTYLWGDETQVHSWFLYCFPFLLLLEQFPESFNLE